MAKKETTAVLDSIRDGLADLGRTLGQRGQDLVAMNAAYLQRIEPDVEALVTMAMTGNSAAAFQALRGFGDAAVTYTQNELEGITDDVRRRIWTIIIQSIRSGISLLKALAA